MCFMIENERSFAMTVFLMDLAFLCHCTVDEHLFFPFDQGCADNDLESDIIGLKLK